MSKPSAFVSYSKSGHDLADLARHKLREGGIEVWLDKTSIKYGSEWRDEIDKGIISSDVIIVLLDEESSKSLYVTYEWAFALGKGKLVIPIKIDDCKLHPRLDVLQYIDFSKGQRPWDKLIERVKEGNEGNAEEAVNTKEIEIAAREAKLVENESNLAIRNTKLDDRAKKLEEEKKELELAKSELSIIIGSKTYLPTIKILNLRADEGTKKLCSDDLKGLYRLVCLEELYLDSNRITDLSFLNGLEKLKILSLHENEVIDINALSYMKNLIEIDLSCNKILDISPLSTLTNLEKLSLSNYKYDITRLSKLPELTSLSLYNCEITDLTPLADLQKLRYLELTFNSIADLSSIVKLSELEELELGYNDNLVDISPLAQLRKLRRVVLKNTAVTDWSPVGHVKIVVGRPD